MFTPEPIGDVRAELGEGPCWDDERQSLWWLDINGKAVHLTDPLSGRTTTFPLAERPTAIAPVADRRVLVALADGLMLLDPDHADQRVRRVTMTLAPGIRLNDGSCDPAGRFWVGSMAEHSRQVLGHLYRWQDGESEVVLGDVTLSNGIDWTSDGTLMYYVDSLRHRVDVFAFDADTGAIRDRQVLAEIPPSEGIPDGLTVDVDGGVWVALFGGGCVRRYDPDGRLDLQVDLPADNVTACSFGGRDYSRLYITTAGERVAVHRRRLQPDAGAVFAVHTGHVRSPTRYLREGHLPAALVDG